MSTVTLQIKRFNCSTIVLPFVAFIAAVRNGIKKTDQESQTRVYCSLGGKKDFTFTCNYQPITNNYFVKKYVATTALRASKNSMTREEESIF